MRIFFLTPFYYDLHVPILNELERQGHEVVCMEDKKQHYDYRFKQINPFLKAAFKLINFCANQNRKLWKRWMAEHPDSREKYDLFLCINGISFHPVLLDFLRKKNPRIRSVLYLWDSLSFYDYLQYRDCFDKIMTFDWGNAMENPFIQLWPSYWCPTKPLPVKYDLSMIGSDHDGRFDFVSKISKQAEEASLSSFLRVVIPPPETPEERLEYDRKLQAPYATSQPFSIDQVLTLIDESRCILDSDRPTQTGATQRVIWALARGKKIISTNTNLKNMPFYRQDQIHFIDRHDPVLDIDFIKNESSFDDNEDLIQLRIDNWVKTLIAR